MAYLGRRGSTVGLAVMLLLVLGIGILVGRWMAVGPSRPLHDPTAEPRPVVPRGDLAADEQATIQLFSNSAPSVVFITTTVVQRNLLSMDESRLTQGTGSGFVWDKDGHIVTNDHVIAGAQRASVTFSDQTVWDAVLVGRAPEKDLAVLLIDAPSETLQPIQVGRSSDLQVGQKAFAIGNPFGLDYTLTTGVISALDRQISTRQLPEEFQVQRTIHGVIQTDAAINPGNSGGPLLDSAGRLIGVNTAIFSPSGAYAGVGFAIPVDTVNRIVPELIRHGRVVRPVLGIEPFADQITRRMQLDGVLIKSITPGSPADQAGIQATEISPLRLGRGIRYQVQFGDLIVAANERPIHNLDDLFTFLEEHNPGDEVTLTVKRNLRTSGERTMEVELVLAHPAEN